MIRDTGSARSVALLYTPAVRSLEGGEYWQGYRQFCATFLTPLLLTAHLGVPFQPLLRSGIAPVSWTLST